MVDAGEIDAGALRRRAARRRHRLPFADGDFDRVITSEVLEHIQDDVAAIAELHRVLKPGGTFAATVPTEWPEKINWMLSDEYHAPKSRRRPRAHLLRHRAEGQAARRRPRRHRHPPRPRPALAVLVAEVRRRPAARRQHGGQRLPAFLEWDIVEQPRSTRVAERR